MGFIAAGYRTQDFKTVYSDRENWVICRRAKIRRSPDSDAKNLRKRHKGAIKAVTIEDLPSELIQRIFVFCGNHELYEVSKFFYRCLKPTSFLLHRFILENFCQDLNLELARTDDTGTRLPVFYGLNGKVFENLTYVSFLNGNPRLVQDVGHIGHCDELNTLQEERLALFNEGGLAAVAGRHKELPKQDYPSIFYSEVEFFFQNDIQLQKPIYNQFILELSAHYEVKQPYYLMETLVHWFFHVNRGQYNVNHLFHALILITHISSSALSKSFDNNGPLIELINNLYLTPGGPELNALLLVDDYTDEEALHRRRIRVLNKFIKKFYKIEGTRATLLSHDILWEALVNVKDKHVIKLIMDYGGQPSFNVIW
ncbi:unnamed protein product [Kluyveromyces dobzhanskii CBS 2104]|uniref:WGS project CCBQ000000000 data, contig 00102 n=1 Tax=Kluyveromyces dobzhanskii CBS 2104 TaxID=1427455 RepID=A0A0A8L446_9SACH|nr:unnamed protein product [Kluyveromyces dobzhanskii CBS 2104]